jgi:hypothetical protein
LISSYVSGPGTGEEEVLPVAGYIWRHVAKGRVDLRAEVLRNCPCPVFLVGATFTNFTKARAKINNNNGEVGERGTVPYVSF